jgi:hypothetical protein
MVHAMSSQLEDMRSTLNRKLDKQDTKENVEAVAEKVDKIMVTMEKQRVDNHNLRDCVQDAVGMKIQEDKDEMEDIRKRSTGVIIHGLIEPSATDGAERKKQDEDMLQHLLHEISCDSVSIQSVIRLGKQDSTQAKPRPMKIVASSVPQAEEILKHAKNLKGTREAKFVKVFLHQDLTVRQRQRRQQLVQEMKQRQANGEVNLMIVNEKIVTRKPRPNQGASG